MFIDTAAIQVRAGKGGDGAVSFHREKYVASGGPDGGDGGAGGSVIFTVSGSCNTLSDFRYRRKFAAADGAPGGAKRCFGKSGGDVELAVPRGTLVYDADTGRLMADMSRTERFVAARGGRGGWGNAHFATPTRQAPRFSKPGLPGEAHNLRLELKLLADVGLVGFPNVGKSTLISVLSEAKPEIADYHFTTLTPVLGVVRVEEGASFVMADIPGILEGASAGVGLGHEFLRHVERCRLLVHVVDVGGSEGRDPLTDFDAIMGELAAFSPELAQRPMLVAGNKCDLAADGAVEAFAAAMTARGYAFYPLMAAIAHGTRELAFACARELAALPPVREFAPEPEPLPDAAAREAIVTRRDDGAFAVKAPWLVTVMRGINPEEFDSLQYFQRVLVSSGVIQALEDAGVQEGDTVEVEGFEFEYIR